ncbi:MAG TPA: DNA repair protein RecN [Stellaceae bacterium]|jgi:DNA repair protein RecN (Recombination protein N)|nr:DNA repair protein RecN [Stellaceae bacterium]
MLLGLSIRDVVLIDKLDLAFRPGLCVLTGETGAGKSILLDALGLALGMRADSSLVRPGASQAMVTAEFDFAADHPGRRLLEEAGIAAENDIVVLRRVVGADGRSRAFVDDQPASIGLLRQLGEMAVEIEGQFAQTGLLDPATHRDTLDAFGVPRPMREQIAISWAVWKKLARDREAAEADFAKARADEDFLRHAMAEISALEPRGGEEAQLAEQRALLVNRERLLENLGAALSSLAGDAGAEHALGTAARAIERAKAKSAGRLDAAAAALERAIVETREAIAELEAASRALGGGPSSLEEIEERLFALRALARKHGVAVEDLPRLQRDFTAKLAAVDDGGAAIAALGRREAEARQAYIVATDAVTKARAATAKKLDAAVMKELPPLKLEKARFHTALTPLAESDWGEHGRERVSFEIATIAGAVPGPLNKIASGGELARFMLALKVVLAKTSPVATLVFDEVDSGVGGATAAAVGERLHRLAEERQVLVVTHSPQVAARAAHHWRVARSDGKKASATRVEALDEMDRREEIARMLSGSAITAEARAAAASLLAGARA